MGAMGIGCRGLFSIPWKWRGAGVLAAVVILGASLALPTQGAAEPPGVKLSDSIDRTLSPPGQNNLTFHTVNGGGRLPGWTGPALVNGRRIGGHRHGRCDDLERQEQGQSAASLFIDFSRDCIGLESRPPQEVSRLFTKGVNQVTLMLHDRCGVAYSSLPYFLRGQLTLRNKKVELQLGRGTNGGRSGDPVNTGTGNFYREEIDLQFPAHVFGLTWGRTYNALDNEVGPFGRGWSNCLGASVTEGDDGVVTFRDEDARTFDFPPDGTSYSRPGQFPGELTKEDGAFVIRWFSGETWRFGGDGRILAKRNWDGQQVDLTYEGDRLVGATGGYGFQLALSYDATGRPTQATASDGRRITYTYGPTGPARSRHRPDVGHHDLRLRRRRAADPGRRRGRTRDREGGLWRGQTGPGLEQFASRREHQLRLRRHGRDDVSHGHIDRLHSGLRA
jgi:Ribosomal protein S4 and related proteins